MGLKKRSKVNAQFNMSSLTDIIFLLLIFFMLTSSIVVPNALNLKLPSTSSSSVSNSEVNTIEILQDGSYRYNNNIIGYNALNERLKSLARVQGTKASVKISPDREAPTQYVIKIMDAARKQNISAILDTPDK